MAAPRRRYDIGGWRLAAVVALTFVVAGLSDQRAATAAAHEAPSLLAIGVFVSQFGLSGYMLIVSAILAIGALLALRLTDRPRLAARARRLAERAIFFFAAIAVSGIACQALKHLVGRGRPRFLATSGVFHFAGPTLHSGYESFPSGHSTTAFAAALALSLMKPAWSVVVFPAAALICVSRVFAEAHYPSDIVAGALLGSLVTVRLARSFAARDIAFTVSDPLRRPATPRIRSHAQERDPRAL